MNTQAEIIDSKDSSLFYSATGCSNIQIYEMVDQVSTRIIDDWLKIYAL